MIAVFALSGNMAFMLGGANTAAAGSFQAIGAMDQAPKHRWDVSVWLQLHGETLKPKLQAQASELMGKEFIWSHVKVEYQVWHGRQLSRGKNKVYVVSVPVIPEGSVWTAFDGKVVTGYKRKANSSAGASAATVVGVDAPRIKSDKRIYAGSIRLFVDEEGEIYY